jgi:uncharacterized protein (DUF2062 family)
MKQKVSTMIKKFITPDMTPTSIARSCSLGVFMAFSPYLGIQTFLTIGFAVILRASTPIAVTLLYVINNPWTMIPIAALDFIFGRFIVTTLLGLDLTPYTPAWMEWVNVKIGSYVLSYVGIDKFCFWSYLIGGNIIALAAAAITYPLVKRAFAKKATK